MRLLKDPKTPLWIRLVSWAVAIIVALLIVRLVFTFGYYASGLAVLDAQKKQREKTPIKLVAQYGSQMLQPGVAIACNDNRFVFYSNFSCEFLPDLDEKLKDQAGRKQILTDYQYLLLWVKDKDEVLKRVLETDRNLELIKAIGNRDDDKGLLYRIN